MKPRNTPSVTLVAQAAALSATLLALLACGGTSTSTTPAPVACPGQMELVVTNQRPQRVRVVEQSAIEPTKTVGEMPGRGTQTFAIKDRAGVIYTVLVAETGELLATETGHPRGATSRGAVLERRCVVEDKP